VAASRLRALIAGVLTGTLLVGAVMTVNLLAGLAACSPYSGPSGVKGPYVLENASNGISLQLPRFAIVSVVWTVVHGPSVNFSVFPPALEVALNCRSPAPSNASYPGGWNSVDPGPVCYESGTNGSCSFMATQFTYWFSLYPPSFSTNPGSPTVNVSFMVSYP
jgi:hypothetical protein